MNKICTSIEQSKKLMELGVDVNTADMRYSPLNPDIPWVWVGKPLIEKDAVPAWSLAALLDILPSGKALIHDKGNLGYKCICNNMDTYFHNNPVDACVELIFKLKEQNLL